MLGRLAALREHAQVLRHALMVITPRISLTGKWLM